MKKTALLFVFIALTISAIAQTDDWYFSVSMGGTWPVGTFSQTDSKNSSSGYAQRGFSLLLDATYPFNTKWGIKGLALINTNSLNNNKLETMLVNRMPQLSEVPNPSYLSVASNPWMWNALLTGPVYTLNFGRVYLDFQVLGGLGIAYLPQQKLLYNNPVDNWYYLDENSSTTSVSLGVLAGTAVRFPISDRLNLKVGVDYYRSSAKLKYQQVNISQQPGIFDSNTIGSGSNIVPIQVITGSIGFVYYLN